MSAPYLYVASSWRNQHYPLVVKALRCVGAAAGLDPADEGHYGVHDFRDAAGYFTWRDIDPDWENWDRHSYAVKVRHPLADVGFDRDMVGLRRATHCLIVGPSGRSAHLELGWACGAGKPTAVYLPEDQEPELMYRMADVIATTLDQVVLWWASELGCPVP